MEHHMTARMAASAVVIASVICAHVVAAPPAKDLPVISTFVGEGPTDALHTLQG